MRMQKGICMELDGDRSVYMLADGRFVTGKPTAGTVVGEEGYFEPAKVSNRRFKPFALPLIASVAALFLYISTWVLPADEAYGYVQVESNPGIEIGVDDEWQVISMRDLNEDGKRLMAKLADWENEEFEAVLQNVLALSVDENTEHVTITTVQEGEGTDATVKVEQIALAALFTGSNQELQIHLKEANKKQWREAKERQVPVARLVDKDRTFTSPRSQQNDVQPAQNEDIKVKQAPESQGTPAKAHQPEPPKVQPENEPAATDTNKTDNPQKPDAPSNPAAEKNNKVKEPAAKAPVAPKETKKPEKSAPAKPKNPNAGKGNNSGNSKAETKLKPDTPSSDKSKAEQPKQDSKKKANPVPGKTKEQEDKTGKGEDKGNNGNNGNHEKGNSNNNGNSSKADKGKATKPKD